MPTLQLASLPDSAAKLPDYTTLACLERCEREYVYRYQQALGAARPDPSAWFGQLVHAGVRSLYEGSALDLSDARLGSESERKPHLTLGYARAICELYRELYFPLTDWACVANERYLESARLGYCGIVDRVLRWKPDGKLYVCDLKTTGLYLSDAWLAQFAHSAQMAGYLDLAEEALGEELAGVWVDAIHVARRSTPKKEDFLRYGPLTYSRDLRLELRQERAARAARLRELQAYPERALKSTGACHRYNASCSFLRFCRADPRDRPDMLKLALVTGELTEAKWEPSKCR